MTLFQQYIPAFMKTDLFRGYVMELARGVERFNAMERERQEMELQHKRGEMIILSWRSGRTCHVSIDHPIHLVITLQHRTQA